MRSEPNLELTKPLEDENIRLSMSNFSSGPKYLMAALFIVVDLLSLLPRASHEILSARQLRKLVAIMQRVHVYRIFQRQCLVPKIL